MEAVYVARQPIFDKEKNIYAYELLFRNGTQNYIPDIDGDEATTSLLSNTFFTIGMKALASGKKTFINFTQNLLEKKVPLLLPKETTVIEILEDVHASPALIAACRQMADQGYTIALDDFEYQAELEPLILMADVIKFDFRLNTIKEIEAYLGKLPSRDLRLLAEKVETNEEFEAALGMNFELFQGYFFCKPEIIKGQEIEGSQVTLMQIMALVNKNDFDIEGLEDLVARDMGIAYKLFKYLNSAFFSRANKVSSVKEALVYLGEKETRRFISLIAMSRLADGKPDELIRMACIRGKLCELLGAEAEETVSASEMFTLGMFSLIDAIIDQPMETILEDLPLSTPIKLALSHAKGRLAGYIALIRFYEAGQWYQMTRLADALKLDIEALPALYMEACEWSDSATKAA